MVTLSAPELAVGALLLGASLYSKVSGFFPRKKKPLFAEETKPRDRRPAAPPFQAALQVAAPPERASARSYALPPPLPPYFPAAAEVLPESEVEAVLAPLEAQPEKPTELQAEAEVEELPIERETDEPEATPLFATAPTEFSALLMDESLPGLEEIAAEVRQAEAASDETAPWERLPEETLAASSMIIDEIEDAVPPLVAELPLEPLDETPVLMAREEVSSEVPLPQETPPASSEEIPPETLIVELVAEPEVPVERAIEVAPEEIPLPEPAPASPPISVRALIAKMNAAAKQGTPSLAEPSDEEKRRLKEVPPGVAKRTFTEKPGEKS